MASWESHPYQNLYLLASNSLIYQFRTNPHHEALLRIGGPSI